MQRRVQARVRGLLPPASEAITMLDLCNRLGIADYGVQRLDDETLKRIAVQPAVPINNTRCCNLHALLRAQLAMQQGIHSCVRLLRSPTAAQKQPSWPSPQLASMLLASRCVLCCCKTCSYWWGCVCSGTQWPQPSASHNCAMPPPTSPSDHCSSSCGASTASTSAYSCFGPAVTRHPVPLSEQLRTPHTS